ncbi:DNA cytosine methyltransferase [Nostoc sp. CENA543]|uniref:DNA cytosine methyltransferase n=1 Tax=Nostoc sp. CENA543 TaxID=1869241 RepID=UPI0012FFDDF8|nr:DNA cytosine methyltransferase [Nostoc sp. CENA543]
MNFYLNSLNSLRLSSRNNKDLTAISLFSGGGGLDLGLSLAGFYFKYANDEVKYYCDTIAHNFPDCITEAKDVRELKGLEIKKLINSNNIALIAGGPPCQSFSILGKRESFTDLRGQLVFEYIRLINEIKPKAFVFENVPGLLTLNKGKDWEKLYYHFKSETGYDIHTDILNAADYGVPQIRKRLFVVGFIQPAEFQFPKPLYRDSSSLDLLEQHLPEWIPSKLALEYVDGLPNQDIRIHGDRVRSRYEKIPPGGRDKVDHTDRIDPEKPSGTVLVGSKAGGGRPHIHPYLHRHITVREAARLQSFPDWYTFLGTSTAQYRQVGNAVPPLLGLAVGKSIQYALQNLSEKELIV